jgi:hypothetical protein
MSTSLELRQRAAELSALARMGHREIHRRLRLPDGIGRLARAAVLQGRQDMLEPLAFAAEQSRVRHRHIVVAHVPRGEAVVAELVEPSHG